MFCVKCGNKMDDEDIFCSQCGWDSRTGGKAKEEGSPPSEYIGVQDDMEWVESAEEEEFFRPENAEAQDCMAQTEDAAKEVGFSWPGNAEAKEGIQQAEDIVVQERHLRKREIPQLEFLPPLPEMVFSGEDTLAGEAEPTPTSKKVPPKKRKLRGKFIGVAAAFAVLLAVLAIVLINWNSIMNALKKNSSPQDYYHWVENQMLDDAAGMAASIYEMYFRRSMKRDDIGIEAEAELSFGEEGKMLLNVAGIFGMDLSWLEDVRLSLQLSSKDKVMGGSAQLGLEGDTIFDLAAFLDVEGEMTYLQLGQLSQIYLGADMGNMQELRSELELLDSIYGALPGEEKTKKLLLKYTKIALACVDDVEMEEGRKIRAQGVSQECTQLTVRIGEDTLEKIALAVLEEMVNDQEIKNIIVQEAEILGNFGMLEHMDADSIYADFQETIKKLCMRVEQGSYFDSDTAIVMKVYVNGSGGICGRIIEQEQYGTVFEFLLPQDGDDFGFQLSCINQYGEEFAVAGKGNVSGTSYSGEFTVAPYGREVFAFEVENVDVEKWKKGFANGILRIPLPYDVFGELGFYGMAPYLGDLTLTLGFSGSSDSMKLTCGIGKGKEEWGSVMVGVKIHSADKLSIPSGRDVIEVDTPEDIWNYMDTLDWDAYIKKLAKTKLPEELVEMLGEMTDRDRDDIYGMLWHMIRDGF